MRLALDNHFSPVLASRLRDSHHDVVAAAERDWHRDPDDVLLDHVSAEQRALVTADVRDFVLIARLWAEQGRDHYGIVLATQAAVPRHRDGLGVSVDVLTRLLVAHPAEAALRNLVHWL